jgi:hypothetical protein
MGMRKNLRLNFVQPWFMGCGGGLASGERSGSWGWEFETREQEEGTAQPTIQRKRASNRTRRCMLRNINRKEEGKKNGATNKTKIQKKMKKKKITLQ